MQSTLNQITVISQKMALNSQATRAEENPMDPTGNNIQIKVLVQGSNSVLSTCPHLPQETIAILFV